MKSSSTGRPIVMTWQTLDKAAQASLPTIPRKKLELTLADVIETYEKVGSEAPKTAEAILLGRIEIHGTPATEDTPSKATVVSIPEQQWPFVFTLAQIDELVTGLPPLISGPKT